MLYHVELVVSDAMRTKLVDIKRQKEEAGEVVEWSDSCKLMSK